ncbi:MAG: hypothetical protein AB7I30_13450 [Isosphaeraceae bacterium]
MSSQDDAASTASAITWRKADVGVLAGLSTLWVLLAVLVDPRGEFPLNDDWGYVLPVEALLQSGSLRFTDWNTASLVAQVFWGALFCLPGGYSLTALRISTVVLGLAGSAGLYGLFRILGAGCLVAAIGGLTLAANPVYFGLSYTFMTDVPFLAVTIGATALLVLGMERDRDGLIWAGLALALLALFVRQIGVALLVGFAAAYPLRRGFRWKWLIQGIAPAAAGFLAIRLFDGYLRSIDQMPINYYKFHQALGLALADLKALRPGALRFPVYRTLTLSLYLGFFLSPLVMALWPSHRRRWSEAERRRGKIRVAVGAIALLAALAVTDQLLPCLGNILEPGPSLGFRALAGDWPALGGLPFWLALTAASCVSAAIAIDALIVEIWTVSRWRIDPALIDRRWLAGFLLATVAVYFGPIALAYSYFFDRYAMGLVPFLGVLVWRAMGGPSARPGRLAIALSLGWLAALLVFDTAATHDYLAWNRTRWAVAEAMVGARGVPRDQFDGGWEFDNYEINRRRLFLTRAERDADVSPEEKKHMSIDRGDAPHRLAVSPLPGYEVIDRHPVNRWSPATPEAILTLRRSP